MAFNSVSLRKDQSHFAAIFPINKENTEDCDVFLCSSCKGNIHQRLTSAQNHDVVSFSDTCKTNGVLISSVCKSYITTVPAINSFKCSCYDLISLIDENA